MTYQTVDTQPERSSMAWSRTRLAMLIGTVLLYRFEVNQHSPWQIFCLIVSLAAFAVSLLISMHRKKALRLGLEEKYGVGHELFFLMIQVVVIALATIGLFI